MKKMLTFSLAAAMLCICPIPAAALPMMPVGDDAVYPNAFMLYVSWDGHFPEGIVNVLSADGTVDHLVFCIAEDADFETVKAQILAQIELKTSAEFIQQSTPPDDLYGIPETDESGSPYVWFGSAQPIPATDADGQPYVWNGGAETVTVTTDTPSEAPSGAVPEAAPAMTVAEEDFVPDSPAEADGIPEIAADDLPDSEILHTAPAIAEYEAPEYEEADDAIPTAEEGGIPPQSPIQHGRDLTLPDVPAAQKPAAHTHFRWYAAGILLLTAAAAAWAFRRRKSILRRSDGSTQTVSAQSRDIPALMAQTAEEPPAALREKIMNRIHR